MISNYLDYNSISAGNILRISLGLIILIAVNIVLGSMNAVFEEEFRIKIFILGIAKGILVIFCFTATYAAGLLTDSIITIEVSPGSTSIIDAMNLIIVTGCTYYAKEVLGKLTHIICAFKDEDEKES